MSINSLIEEFILLFNLISKIQLDIESIEIIDEFGNRIIVKWKSTSHNNGFANVGLQC